MTHVIRVDNTCQALPEGVAYLLAHGEKEETRAGPALVAPGPVLTLTLRPTQRVLFSSVRDANPFFHLYESMWMLAGRDDAAPLNSFVKQFGSSYGEPGGEVHGAYGRRWRTAFGFDQLEYVVQKLRRDPLSRQCVLQMWDCTPRHMIHVEDSMNLPAVDLLGAVGDDDLRGGWRDRPCNTHVYIRVRDSTAGRVLDLTVLCRSNDMLWGAHGANAVHFSVLQEYLAARVGAGVGFMIQLSNNYHLYVSEVDRLARRAAGHAREENGLAWCLSDDRYATNRDGRLATEPMFSVPRFIDGDCRIFCGWFDEGCEENVVPSYANEWFSGTLSAAMMAHAAYRRGDVPGSARRAEMIVSPDWRVACTEWLWRRSKT